MSNTSTTRPTDQADQLADREEVLRHLHDLRQTVFELIDGLDLEDDADTTRRFTRITQLQKAQDQILTTEEKFKKVYGAIDDDTEKDLAGIRDELGRALDRIRAAQGAGEVSEPDE